MYEIQDDRIRRTAMEADMLLSEERVKAERVLHDSRNEKHPAVEKMREEA